MSQAKDSFLYELEEELHDLCQPLTALHFRLELGKFGGDPEALRDAVDGALEESGRMIGAIERMRERLSSMTAGAECARGADHVQLGRRNSVGGASN